MKETHILPACVSLIGVAVTAGADRTAMIKAAMKQSPPAMDINTGYEIPSEGYRDLPFIEASEGWFLGCDGILTEKDPDKLTWTTLPEGENPIKAPAGPITSEVNLTSLSDGSLFCVYRTIEGHPGHAYSRDSGKTWTEPAFMTYGPGGPKVTHPRAACPVHRLSEGPYAGRYPLRKNFRPPFPSRTN